MRRMIASVLSILVATCFAITLASPAAAGDQHHRYRGDADRAMAGVFVGAIAGAILGGIIATQPRHHNRVPYYDNNDRRGYYQQPRVHQDYRYSNVQKRKLWTNGQRIRGGDYCEGYQTFRGYDRNGHQVVTCD